MSLYTLATPGSPGDPADLIAPTLVAAFDGWVDSGAAATTALEALIVDAPIVATFDGVAVDSSNSIGGRSVKVMGEYGFTYNAHLSAFGQLGPVEQGDVVGYVGATGNASGPHLHFEWHPDDGEAVDPYEFLLLVC